MYKIKITRREILKFYKLLFLAIQIYNGKSSVTCAK